MSLQRREAFCRQTIRIEQRRNSTYAQSSLLFILASTNTSDCIVNFKRLLMLQIPCRSHRCPYASSHEHSSLAMGSFFWLTSEYCEQTREGAGNEGKRLPRGMVTDFFSNFLMIVGDSRR